MTTITQPDAAAINRIPSRTDSRRALRTRGLSDRTIAWLFVAPTIALLARDQYLSADLDDPAVLHQPHLSMSYLPLRVVGLDNFTDILTDEDVWMRLQTTARFVICSVTMQVIVGFGWRY